MSFSIRPVHSSAPAYPENIDPAEVSRTAPRRWAAAAGFVAAAITLLGCPIGQAPMGAMVWEDTATWTEGEVLACEASAEVFREVAEEQGWMQTAQIRPLWDSEAVHMGDAQVYAKGEQEILMVSVDDAQLTTAWQQGQLTPCPVLYYEGSCDLTSCDSEPSGTPCAQLVQVPCEAGHEVFYRERFLSIIGLIEG